MIEALIEIFFEFGLQIVIELFAEWGTRSTVRRREGGPPPAWLAGVGYFVLGGLLGGASLLVFPAHWVTDPGLRLVNLLVTPVIAGLLMSALGAWRRSRGQELLRLDKFTHGWLFALALALVRHFGARAA
ncbi:MAG TPA: hypothetical protein PK490_15210 [Prosthecobacter sp.]|nr:hypothetical protein [Prosthecobacter sp.]HRK15628.1 hypothetical protein [Prosthecobacter sp.]